MRVPAFIGQAQTHVHHAWQKAKEAPRLAKDWIVHQFNQIKQQWEQDIWPKHLKPLYERHIAPLNKTDAIILTTSVAVALAIAVLVPVIFGKALIALTAVSGLVLVLGAATFCHHRVRKHFDEKAWEHLDQARRIANNTTYRTQNFPELMSHLGHLHKTEFNHLEQDVKTLEEPLRAFRKAATSPYYADLRQVVSNHLLHLKNNIVAGQAADVQLIEALEQEVAKVGTPQQNLGELENKRLALNGFVTPEARPALPTLLRQIEDLKQATVGPSFQEAKEVFMNHLTTLQHKLASHRNIEVLPNHQPSAVVA